MFDRLEPELQQVYDEVMGCDLESDAMDGDEPVQKCEDCHNPLPTPVIEDRGSGYAEAVTYCPCGATYITK